MRAAVISRHQACVALAAAAIISGIAVQAFAPQAAARHAHAVAAAHDRGEIADDQDHGAVRAILAQKTDSTLESASLQSTHSNPSALKSCSNSAGVAR